MTERVTLAEAIGRLRDIADASDWTGSSWPQRIVQELDDRHLRIQELEIELDDCRRQLEAAET